MTLFGICGSTALLLVGFGLQDSINSIVDIQYGKISLYDEMLTLNTSATAKDKDLLISTLEEDSDIAGYISTYVTTTDVETEDSDGISTCYIYVPENMEDLDDYIVFQDRTTGEAVEFTTDAVLISEKMSTVMGLSVGDTFEIFSGSDDERTVTVGGIVENYVYHNIFMSEELYEELYGEEPVYNQMLILNVEGSGVDSTAFGEKYLSLGAVSGVTSVSYMKDYFADMMSSLDSITLVLIVCAGALTFIVLFNLTNINISERRRELATLKVLGFYDIELSQYIYRENLLITVIGIAVGLFIGKYLNSFVITTVEVDMVMFGRDIFTSSYIISAALAMGFAVIVNIIVHFKLKKIDMATSLKSVE